MYFDDRIALGKKLAHELEEYRGKSAVIICLKEESLLTCLTMGQELRAWVYPLMFAPVYSRNGTPQLLGAFDDAGMFCPDSKNVSGGIEQLPADVRADIESQKQTAIQQLEQQRAKYDMILDKRSLDRRDVIIASDIVTSVLPIKMAMSIVDVVNPKSLTIAIGNASSEVADLARISVGKTVVLDVLSGIILDDERYFEHSDTYTPEQKYKLTKHIATYWQ